MTPWDTLALQLLGDEYRLQELMAAQRVASWDSPVYSFTVEDATTIAAPAAVVEQAAYYKAPWEV